STPSLCAGSSATLTGTGTLSYTWQPGGSTATTIVVSPSVTTVYTLSGSNGIGCSNVTTFTLNVGNPSPLTASASSPTICEGFTTALTAGGASAGSYTWEPGTIPGSVITVTPSGSTTYTVFNDNGSCI